MLKKSLRTKGVLLAGAVALTGAAIQAKEAIVGGRDITIEEAPWQLLMLSEEEGGGTGNCGASWIGGRWVITAAHCVEGNDAADIGIYAGITKRSEAKSTNRLKVAKIISHPDYPKQWKDIAILELAQDVTSTKARPIRMATLKDVAAGATRPGATVMATGWGGVNRNGQLAETLQGVTSKVYDTTRYTIKWAGLGGSLNVGSCGGDSGGPCVVKDALGVDWVLAGISSTISSYCGDPDSPSSYTRVSSFHTWVTGFTGTPVTLQPLRPEGSDAVAFAGNGRFSLRASRNLEITVAGLDGSILVHTRRFYPAGEYPISAVYPAAEEVTGSRPNGSAGPRSGGYAGLRILRIQGEGLDIRRSF